MSTFARVLSARDALLNGGGKLDYFEQRGISRETIQRSYVGYESRVVFRGYEGDAFSFPCIAREGGLLGIHLKSVARDDKGRRYQRWDGHAEDLPPRGHGKNPEAPAKIIPWGMETLRDLEPGAQVILNCGEEDALSLRQAGYTAISQPGAGLLEPVYAKELGDFDVVVFYDAGEERAAREDALTLKRAGAWSVRVVEWPSDAPHGADVNGRLVEGEEGFVGWAARMIEGAKPLIEVKVKASPRTGIPDSYSTPMQEPSAWPERPEEALYGLPGDIVETVEPHTEADPVAVLGNLLVAFGSAVGRNAYVCAGMDRHHLNLFLVQVGETSKGRKGTSWSPVVNLMHAIDLVWAEERVAAGLSTGEGLIHAVRDEVEKMDKDGATVVVDPGVSDKRLLVMEGEYAKVLKVMSRQGNMISPVMRQAWDGDKLQVLTRSNPLAATGAHVSLLAHITKPELLRHLTETEAANGFGNRNLFVMVRRSKILPFGGMWHEVNLAPLVKRLGAALEFGNEVGEVTWGESAKPLWVEVYGPLSEGKPGLFGAVTGRAEAQVLRLGALYAVLNLSRTIELPHLEAALSFWGYAEQSARYIFGDATGDPVADRIVLALRGAGDSGMTRTELRDLFGRHKSAGHIDRALALLLEVGRVRRKVEPTAGRSIERWFLK